MTPTQQTLVALMVAAFGGGGLTAVIVKGFFNRPYMQAKAGDAQGKAWHDLVTALNEQRDKDRARCDEQLSAQQAEIETLKRQVGRLQTVVDELRRRP